MKKTLKLIILFILALVAFTTMANAATPEERVIAYASQTISINGETFKLSSSDILRVEKYFNQYPITDEVADQIIAKGDQILGILKESGVANPMKLSKDKRNQVLAIAQDAASLAKAKLTYDSSTKTGVVTNGNKEVDRINMNSPVLVQTGKTNISYCVAGVAIIAVATITIMRLKTLKANV